MNLAAWVAEVRRLLRALDSPNRGTANGHVALTHHMPTAPSGKGQGAKPARWVATCEYVANVEGNTPEEAAAALIARLEADLSQKIETHRAELARLEAARGARLRVVRAEKPS
jgi:hypothetical protein